MLTLTRLDGTKVFVNKNAIAFIDPTTQGSRITTVVTYAQYENLPRPIIIDVRERTHVILEMMQ